MGRHGVPVDRAVMLRCKGTDKVPQFALPSGLAVLQSLLSRCGLAIECHHFELLSACHRGTLWLNWLGTAAMRLRLCPSQRIEDGSIT